jgi:MFS family permease
MPAISTAPDVFRTAQRWTLVLGSFASFLVGLNALVVTTALPTLHQELGAGVEGLQLALHYNPLGVGLRLLPATGMALLLAPIAGRLADRIGERPLVMLGLGLEATGLLLIGALVTDTSGYRTLVGPLFIAGAGIAIAFPTVTTAVMRSVGPDETAVASGISNTFRQVGAVFGVAIATAIFAAEGGYRTSSEFVDGLSPAFIALGVLCAIGVLAGVLLQRAPSVGNPRTALMAAPPRRAHVQ